MENAEVQQSEIALYQLAAEMMQQGRKDIEISQALREQGAEEAQISTIIDNVGRYRKQAKKDQGGKNMLYGGLWCVGGLVATMLTDGQVLFYGAIIVGAIQFIAGLVQSASD